jgi:hypothetical protein
VIVTLTLNPSLDRAVEVERLEPGTVIRALKTRDEPEPLDPRISLEPVAGSES